MQQTNVTFPANSSVGTAIRRARKAAGLTLQELDAKTGTNHGNLSKIENGKLGFSRTTVEKIAEAIGVSVQSLLEKNTEPCPDIEGTVPLISWVAAGNWEETIDSLQIGQGERIPTTYRVRPHTYALRVRGDSMEPKFPDGAILIIEPDEEPLPGKFVIVRQNGDTDTVFKQLVQDGGTFYLKPLNDRYPILQLKADAVFCGVVKKMEMDV